MAGVYDVTGQNVIRVNPGDGVDFSGTVQGVGSSHFVGVLNLGTPLTTVTFHNTPITVTDLTLSSVVLTTGAIQATNVTWTGARCTGRGP